MTLPFVCNIYGLRWISTYTVHTLCVYTYNVPICLHGIEFTFLVSCDSIKSKRNDVLATNRCIAELVFMLSRWCEETFLWLHRKHKWQQNEGGREREKTYVYHFQCKFYSIRSTCVTSWPIIIKYAPKRRYMRKFEKEYESTRATQEVWAYISRAKKCQRTTNSYVQLWKRVLHDKNACFAP